MKASKENAEACQMHVRQLRLGIAEATFDTSVRKRLNERLLAIEEFLEAAKRKLPTNAAYEKDRRRQRSVPAGTSP